MSKPSKNPRKDIGTVLIGHVMAPFELADKDFHNVELAGGVSLNEEQRSKLNMILENYISFTKAIQDRPARQAVRNELDKWRKCALTLFFSTASHDATPDAAMKRLREMQFDEERKHLWNGAQFGQETRMRLSYFAIACEKAIYDIDQKTAADKGGKTGNEQRDMMLYRLESLLLDAGGKKQFRECFIRTAVIKLPEEVRPKLPKDDGEILKIISAAKRRMKNRRKLPLRKGE